MLRKLGKDKLDADCVAALVLNEKEVKAIQAQFLDEGLGGALGTTP